MSLYNLLNKNQIPSQEMFPLIILLCFSSPIVMNCYDHLTPDNAALLLIDHQTGLFEGVADQIHTDFKSNILALVEIGKLFNLPTILATSAEDGPNGPLLPEIVEAFPDAPIIRRPGQINAWDNEDFVNAVEQTGRKKLIMAGIATDVCVTFAALSAQEAGYDVYAVIDSSGTWSKLLQELSIERMSAANITVINWFAVACELQGDWRNDTGAGLAKLFGTYLPFYGNLITSLNHIKSGSSVSASTQP
jgi:nicotinamidase-related amidase